MTIMEASNPLALSIGTFGQVAEELRPEPLGCRAPIQGKSRQ